VQTKRTVGLIRLSGRWSATVLWAARGLGAAGVCLVAILVFAPGIPRSLLHDNWEQGVQWIALAIAAAGYMLAWRWEGAGSTVVLAASATFGILATLVDEPGVPLTACLALLVVAALLLLHWQQRHQPLALFGVVALLAAFFVAGSIGAGQLYDHYLGPTHPESMAARIPVDVVRWIWSGAVTTDGFTVKAMLARNGEAPVLLVSESDSIESPLVFPSDSVPHGSGDIVTFRLSGLRPGTTYHYAVRQGAEVDRGRSGRATTFPAGPASFTIAFGSCSRTGSNGAVWDRIREADPLFMLVTGDFHYENISENDPSAIRKALGRGLASPAQQSLWLQAPLVYTWDDHDFGGDNSDRTMPLGRPFRRFTGTTSPTTTCPRVAKPGRSTRPSRSAASASSSPTGDPSETRQAIPRVPGSRSSARRRKSG